MTRFIVLLALLTTSLAAGQPPRGFTALFNDKDLTGWRGGTTYDHRKLLSLPAAERAELIRQWTESMTEVNPKTGLPHWRVDDGVLINDGHGDYATTKKDYGDFELLLEYKTVPEADSGVYLRGVPQVQIWDYNQADPHGLGRARGSGGLWNNTKGSPGKDPLVRADKPLGEWNTIRVLMVGSRVSVWLNQQLVVDHAVLENYYDKIDKTLKADQRRPIPARGPIQLQTHGGEIHWRNIYIREIDGTEACDILQSRGNEGFQSIAGHKSLPNWSGDTEILKMGGDGILLLGKKGQVFWKERLETFSARMQFRSPPGARSGVTVGVLSGGKTAVLQELPAGGTPDYLHPAGEWNFQEVAVVGSTLTVELNGTPVLKTKLPDSDSGGYRFGVVGHGEEVEYKSLTLRTP